MRTEGAEGLLVALNSQVVRDVVTAVRRLDGPPPLTKGAEAMSIGEYTHLRDSTGPLPCRQLLAIAWLRAARTNDIVRMRQCGLWQPKAGCLAIELGQEKARRLGLPGYIVVALPPEERALLRPLLRDQEGRTRKDPPLTRPSTRPALLSTTYEEFAGFVRQHRPEGSRSTPHSVRKGAVARMVNAGIPLKEVALITQHRSVEGLLAYVTTIDRSMETAMLRASRAITAPEQPTQAGSHRTDATIA